MVWLWWDTLAADVRQAIRGFAKAPGFTLTVLAALALGIAANTAIFTVVKTVLLDPLPYPNADRIVSVGGWREEGGISEPIFAFWEQNNPGFEDLTAYHSGARMNLNARARRLASTVPRPDQPKNGWLSVNGGISPQPPPKCRTLNSQRPFRLVNRQQVGSHRLDGITPVRNCLIRFRYAEVRGPMLKC